jgi:hypothetical protein
MAQASEGEELQRRLAEIDEQLASLQAELADDARVEAPGPAPARSEPPRSRRRRAPRIYPPPEPVAPPGRASDPPPPPPSPPAADPSPPAPADPLEVMCARLLAATGELLAGYEVALHRALPAAGGQPALTLRAGPFRATAMVAEFERALRGLPVVADVAVRGYEGADRAILEVRLRESAR